MECRRWHSSILCKERNSVEYSGDPYDLPLQPCKPFSDYIHPVRRDREALRPSLQYEKSPVHSHLPWRTACSLFVYVSAKNKISRLTKRNCCVNRSSVTRDDSRILVLIHHIDHCATCAVYWPRALEKRDEDVQLGSTS
jgi:hypothetical protein